MKNEATKSSSPYLRKIKQTLPRVLALFDRDKTSQSIGMGDRYFWAWGLTDFGNATYQSAAHGFARLWKNGLWPYPTTPKQFHARINDLFTATKNLTRKDGSLEEAFPNEGSYCVTALVAFDLLCTIELLKDEIDEQTLTSWQSIIGPLVHYLLHYDETHAVISNHIATASAALLRWHKLVGDKNAEIKAKELVQSILQNQSVEGWFMEYEGADQGYQSFCTYYLADVHLQRPDILPLEPLQLSVQFLWHFAHPDGSFGGLYGSRCTRFYCPAGIELLAGSIPEAATLAKFMNESISNDKVVSLSTMDDSNLIPMFNAFCYAVTVQQAANKKTELILPALRNTTNRIKFHHAGIIIDQGVDYYSIISTSKGGVVYHFVDGVQKSLDGGVVVKKNGIIGSTQMWSSGNESTEYKDSIVVLSEFKEMPKHLPTPIQFLLLRTLCITCFRIAPFREWIKKKLVKRLIISSKSMSAQNTRTIQLGIDLSIKDVQSSKSAINTLDVGGYFVPIHMASQGYWQTQDEESGDNRE